MNRRQALQRLARAIRSVVGDSYGRPKVLGKSNGFTHPTLCWDGPFEWTMITAGSSVYAGQLGNYSLETEPKIAQAIEEIRAAGFYLEPANNSQLIAWEA